MLCAMSARWYFHQQLLPIKHSVGRVDECGILAGIKELNSMLELRPNCECCDKNLPPDSQDACICSYECTFCAECVENLLQNVCPNCGGGFVPRPIRPKVERRPGVCLVNQPASTKRVNTKYRREEIVDFCGALKEVAPENR